MSSSTRKILLATDGSDEAVRAAEIAVRLATDIGMELHILNVRPVPEAYVSQWAMYAPHQLDELFEYANNEARVKAEEEAAKVGDMGIEVAGIHARVGRTENEIVKFAEDFGAEVVVVGSRGLGAMKRALIGSVSLSVVRHSHGSVLVARGERLDGSAYLPGRILVATDGSRMSEAALESAKEIAKATGSELHIIYVLPDAPSAPYPYPLAVDQWKAQFEEVKEKARNSVEDRAKRIKESGGEVAWAGIVFGEADREIVRRAEEINAGLIVVGNRGLGGVKRALMGSVSDSVVRHAHCPVFIVRKYSD